MRCFLAWLSALIVLLICAEAQAGKHAALIAGSAVLPSAAPLDTPRSDAAAEAAASHRLGFRAGDIETSLILLNVCLDHSLERNLATSRLEVECDLLAENGDASGAELHAARVTS
jgi:hypothetical protein